MRLLRDYCCIVYIYSLYILYNSSLVRPKDVRESRRTAADDFWCQKSTAYTLYSIHNNLDVALQFTHTHTDQKQLNFCCLPRALPNCGEQKLNRQPQTPLCDEICALLWLVGLVGGISIYIVGDEVASLTPPRRNWVTRDVYIHIRSWVHIWLWKLNVAQLQSFIRFNHEPKFPKFSCFYPTSELIRMRPSQHTLFAKFNFRSRMLACLLAWSSREFRVGARTTG